MKILFAAIALVLFVVIGSQAEMTNALSDAEVQGRELAGKIRNQWPVDNQTNHAILVIRDSMGNRKNLALQCVVTVADGIWKNLYQYDKTNILDGTISGEKLLVSHRAGLLNSYGLETFSGNRPKSIAPNTSGVIEEQQNHVVSTFLVLSEDRLNRPFAGSDFWICDLGLEFFQWPTQKLLKKEIHRSCACTVLESTNPNPTTNGYSRVVSWIENDSLGVVEAYAYDFNGKKLKNFYPKDIKKVNGQWQVQTLVMENLQTGSKSRIEFDLKK